MDSRYRKFLALADTSSFSAAARRLHVTQPAISLAVASLEHALGVRLYVRRSRPIVLTPEGRTVADAARGMEAEHERMLAALQAEAPAERVRIGLIDSIAHLLYESDDERPLLQSAEVLVDNSRRILRDLRDGRIDFGIITGQLAEPGSDVVVHKLHDEEFVFVAAPGRAGGGASNRIDDWLATNPDSTTYTHFLQLFRRRHLQVTPVFHSASMELLRDMAIAGQGTALLPRHIVQNALNAGQLTVIHTKPLSRPIWTISSRRQNESIMQTLATRINGLLAAAVS
ncbi:MAG TPA: LysR family transcriptional regulator [Candidatus Saccharimonadales bacterium]